MGMKGKHRRKETGKDMRRASTSCLPSSFCPSLPSSSLTMPASEFLLAAHFIGVVLSTIFYGITLAQAFAYYRTYISDPRHMKFIVAFLLLLDTTQVFLASASIYSYAIRLRDDVDELQYVSRPLIISMAVTSSVAFTVQMIYAYRVWRLSAGNAYLTTAIITLSFTALGSSMAMITKMTRNPRWDETRASDIPAALILSSTVTCDLLIASAQVWLFHRHRLKRVGMFGCFMRRSVSPTMEETTVVGGSTTSFFAGIPGFAGLWRMGPVAVKGVEEDDGCRLGALLTTLTLLVVNVGLLPSMDALLFLVLFLVCPGNGAFLVPYILLSNCYVNSFLSILNSRRILRDLVENPEHFPVTFDFGLDIAIAIDVG
ncbi:hypothetical protein FB45DRAFT_905983 [Roridomyces roridus]|uniref:DUF6534 domain-containing protein n=1 Tax=Roridomyces roridus TaxID=1738132 RepID=A0AAD7FS01_9AGAR|nr:hypothetical protein FB45DRAFT_905983 [Roridomyces roridus]